LLKSNQILFDTMERLYELPPHCVTHEMNGNRMIIHIYLHFNQDGFPVCAVAFGLIGMSGNENCRLALADADMYSNENGIQCYRLYNASDWQTFLNDTVIIVNHETVSFRGSHMTEAYPMNPSCLFGETVSGCERLLIDYFDQQIMPLPDPSADAFVPDPSADAFVPDPSADAFVPELDDDAIV
jgi:hypothetical protein